MAWYLKKRLATATLAMAALAQSTMATTLEVNGVSSPPTSYATITEALIALGAVDGNDATPDVINVTVNKLNNHPGILINGIVPSTLPSAGAPPFAFPGISDPLTINGDADGDNTPCTVVLAAGVAGTAAGGYSFTDGRFVIELNPQHIIAINDLTLVPAFIPGGGTTNSAGSDGGTRATCMIVDDGPDPAVSCNAILEFNNVTITASDSNNDPVDPFAANTSLGNPTMYWSGEFVTGSLSAAVVIDNTVAANNNFDFRFNDLVVAHIAADGTNNRNGLGLFCDANGGLGQVTITNSHFLNASTAKPNPVINASGFGNGINLGGTEGTDIIFDNVNASFNNGSGIFSSADHNIAGGSSAQVDVIGGNYSNNNNSHGMFFRTDPGDPLLVRLLGTRTNPVTVCFNGNTPTDVISTDSGIRIGSDGDDETSLIAEHVVVVGNSGYGLDMFEYNEDGDPDGAGPRSFSYVQDSIFANNRSNVRIGSDNTPVVPNSGFEIVRCTLHNPDNSGSPEYDANFRLSWQDSDGLTINIIDTIFSGDSADDAAFSEFSFNGSTASGGDDNILNLSRCAFVQFGADSLSTNPTVLVRDDVEGLGNIIDGVAVEAFALPATIADDNPVYASNVIPAAASFAPSANPSGWPLRDAFTSNLFDITNGWVTPNGYASYGQTVINLEGGADFVPSYPYEPNGVGTTPPWPQVVFIHPYDALGSGNNDLNNAVALNTTAFTGPTPAPLTPFFTWTVTNPQVDPNTVSPILAARNAAEYWTIDHDAPGANDVTADVGIFWADSDLPFATPNINVHRFNGANWVAQNPANLIFPNNPNPGFNGALATSINEFSPFAIIANNVLAVDLASFSAAQTGSTVTVEWSTAAELDNAGFVVYRTAADGSLGEKLSGLIPAEGSATAGASYSFVDDAPFAADETSRSYLLVDIDLSGSETTHGPATATITTGSPSSVGNWTMY